MLISTWQVDAAFTEAQDAVILKQMTAAATGADLDNPSSSRKVSSVSEARRMNAKDDDEEDGEEGEEGEEDAEEDEEDEDGDGDGEGDEDEDEDDDDDEEEDDDDEEEDDDDEDDDEEEEEEDRDDEDDEDDDGEDSIPQTDGAGIEECHRHWKQASRQTPWCIPQMDGVGYDTDDYLSAGEEEGTEKAWESIAQVDGAGDDNDGNNSRQHLPSMLMQLPMMVSPSAQVGAFVRVAMYLCVGTRSRARVRVPVCVCVCVCVRWHARCMWASLVLIMHVLL